MHTEQKLFTDREEQILNLLANYHTREEMSTILKMKRATVTTHIINIRRKTNKRGIKLIKYAIEQGFGKQEASA